MLGNLNEGRSSRMCPLVSLSDSLNVIDEPSS
jgi:hypothetical protein